jgi:hypothetical protein
MDNDIRKKAISKEVKEGVELITFTTSTLDILIKDKMHEAYNSGFNSGFHSHKQDR